MQALLGFGYLLTVLHEKHLGGHIEFTASALTAAASTTPAMANSHMRHRASFSSSGGSWSRAGMLAGLQKAVQECPSLSPIGSFTPRRRSTAGPAVGSAAAAAAAAANSKSSQMLEGNSSSTPGLQQQQQAGPSAGASAGGSFSESDVVKPLGGSNSFEVVWERINSPTPGGSGGRGAMQGLSLQLSLSAPLGTTCSSSLARVLEEKLDQATAAAAAAATDSAAVDAVKECSSSVGRDSRRSTAAGAADAAAGVSLSKEPDMGRSGDMEKLLEEALQQLAEVDPAAVGLTAAAGGAVTPQQVLQQRSSSADGGMGRIESPFSSYQNLLQEAELEAAVAGE
jgi:hypothetical protein